MSSGTRVLTPEFAYQSLQLAWQPARLASGFNLDARAPSGHQHVLERGGVPQVRERLQQGKVRLAVGSDAHHAQRVAVTQVGPGAVPHDEQPAADALRGVDPGTRARAVESIDLALGGHD